MSEISENEYASYYAPYVQLVRNPKSLTENLKDTLKDGLLFFKDLPEEKRLHRYATGKWTIKEIVQHIIDTERVFAYRALRFARNDATDLPGFDQNDYVNSSNCNDRDFNALLNEFKAVREATILLFQSFTEDALIRKGTASNNTLSVRAAGYIISGHLMHHTNIIKERYL